MCVRVCASARARARARVCHMPQQQFGVKFIFTSIYPASIIDCSNIQTQDSLLAISVF